MTWELVAGIAAVLIVCMVTYTRFHVYHAKRRHPPRGETVDVDGIQTHLVHEGREDETTVVLLHGLNGILEDFTGPVVERLSERYEVLLPDRPGYGYTKRPDRSLSTLGGQTRWLEALLSRQGADHVVLVGHSMGAALATRFALDHPDRVRGLVLVSPYLYPSQSVPRSLSLLSRVPVLRHVLVHLFLVPLGRPLARRLARKSFEPEPMPTGYPRLWADFTLRPRQALTVIDEMAHLDQAITDMVTDYQRLEPPTLVLTGDKDRFVGPENHAHRLHREAPSVWLRTVEGAGHALVWTRPGTLIEAVDEISHLSKRAARSNGGHPGEEAP